MEEHPDTLDNDMTAGASGNRQLGVGYLSLRDVQNTGRDYAAGTTNGLARLTWALYISPGQQVVQQHIILLLGCLELLRRAQWALLRMEWEQHHRNHKIAEAAATTSTLALP